jgi:hypothetical protein
MILPAHILAGVLALVFGYVALYAMWVAAGSFFWGPPGRVPEVIRIPPLLAV